jgi:hypothetical protein
MRLTHGEYAVLSELITMPDRNTAATIELMLFPDVIPTHEESHQPAEYNSDLLKELELLLWNSKTGVDFHNQLAKIAKERANVKVVPQNTVYPCNVQGVTPVLKPRGSDDQVSGNH